jgi:hypothetical protein
MPPVTHAYGEGVKSEHLEWILARHVELGEPIDLEEADRNRMRAWDCGCSPWKQENGRNVGVRYKAKVSATVIELPVANVPPPAEMPCIPGNAAGGRGRVLRLMGAMSIA